MGSISFFRLLLALVTESLVVGAPPPSLMLWAWERPGDLRALPSDVGVAFLASSVFLDAGNVSVTPRFQPLRVSPATFRMAVVRVAGTVSGASPRATATAIADTFRATHADALQVDFDARASERSFYAELLRDLRTKLGNGVFLSITSLVSWCGAGSWLEKLPVDEVVPMAFEMGAAADRVETLLRSGGKFGSPVCRGSIGIATSEISLRPKNSRRTYVFAYEDWTADLVRSLVGQLR